VQTAANLWASANDAANRDYTAGIAGASRGFTAGDDAQGRALGAGLGIAMTAASICFAPFTGGASLAGIGSVGGTPAATPGGGNTANTLFGLLYNKLKDGSSY
jgi:hypothetical protein